MSTKHWLRRGLLLAATVTTVGAAFATDGTWVKRDGVGTGGTDWAEWTDVSNWDGEVVADQGYADLSAAKGQYISLPEGTTTLTSFSGAGNSGANKTVVRGNGTLAVTTPRQPTGGLWLYCDYTIANSSIYCGPGMVQCCDQTSRSGSAWLLWWGMQFRMDLYANAAGGTRTTGPIPSNTDYKWNAGSLAFTAPHGSPTNIVANWSQTAGSPFLSRAVGQSEHVLSVGTAVSGVGIPDGTFLKRVFPDGTIELSNAATATAAGNALTFAALTSDVSFSIGSVRPYNGSETRTLKVQKYREEDEIAITTLFSPQSATPANKQLTITADEGLYPGKLILKGCTDAFTMTLAAARIGLEGSLPNVDVIVPATSRGATLSVGEGLSCSVGRLTQVKNTLIKEGAGTLTIGVAEDVLADAASAVVVKGGTFAPVIYGDYSGLYISALTVKAGATILVPDAGLHVGTLVLEAGATVTGNGVLEYDTANEEDFGAVAIIGGGLRRYGAVPTGALGVSVLSGVCHSWAEDGDTVLIFDSGSSTIKIDGRGTLDLLCVGGGGGGGTFGGGGGGGGGVVYTQSLEVVEGYYGLRVGAGGAGSTAANAAGANGGDSSVFGIYAYGGGGGGTVDKVCNGGCGGGAGANYYMSAKVRDGGLGTEGQGYAGGKSYTSGTSHWNSLGGGGGGAGTNGCDATTDPYLPGNGGEGVRCAIWSADRVYGSGGGGGNGLSGQGRMSKGGTGAGAGGGNSSAACSTGLPGTDGCGAGGGGGGRYVSNFAAGGNGGGGIVIVRFRQDTSTDIHDRGALAGGTVRYRKGVAYRTFAANGTLTVTEPTFVDLLLVGGGGGGGSYGGGGGGGGGVTVVSNFWLAAGTYPVEVGLGGAGAPDRTTAAAAGGTTRLVTDATDIYCPQAPGGGQGAVMSNSGGTGACGGGAGAGYPYNGAASYAGGVALPNWGFDGGASTNADARPTIASRDWNNCYGGGGGGMGEAGVTGAFNPTVPGKGGDGICLDFTGKEVWYGGGGGGGTSMGMQSTSQDFAAGGLGGGGIGRATYAGKVFPGTDGIDGLGGGGGGGSGLGDQSAAGGKGGDGVLVIRYRVQPLGLTVIFK